MGRRGVLEELLQEKSVLWDPLNGLQESMSEVKGRVSVFCCLGLVEVVVVVGERGEGICQ